MYKCTRREAVAISEGVLQSAENERRAMNSLQASVDSLFIGTVKDPYIDRLESLYKLCYDWITKYRVRGKLYPISDNAKTELVEEILNLVGAYIEPLKSNEGDC
jgi:hypothetical protein